MTEIKLEPCPFCSARNTTGEPVTMYRNGKNFFVGCDVCESWGPVTETEKAAAQSWNRVSQAVHSEVKLAP